MVQQVTQSRCYEHRPNNTTTLCIYPDFSETLVAPRIVDNNAGKDIDATGPLGISELANLLKN
jgi:hypothetical protein